MRSLEEVIKYKLRFLPKRIDPFYDVQTWEKNTADSSYLYETKNHPYFSKYTDTKPLFNYILSCDKYYRENSYRRVETTEVAFKYTKF